MFPLSTKLVNERKDQVQGVKTRCNISFQSYRLLQEYARHFFWKRIFLNGISKWMNEQNFFMNLSESKSYSQGIHLYLNLDILLWIVCANNNNRGDTIFWKLYKKIKKFKSVCAKMLYVHLCSNGSGRSVLHGTDNST